MAVYKIVAILLLMATLTIAQRPFYAGSAPIGYPQMNNDILLSNRFGEDEPLPIEAKGDRNLINRIESLPVDSRPFWYLNWLQYEALRKRPQTYPQRPNSFINK